MSEELKPCPFCGGEAAHDKWDEDRDYAGCRKCDFWAHARIWNNRTQYSELAALRTKLEEAERKLAQARAEGMEEAAKVVETSSFGGDLPAVISGEEARRASVELCQLVATAIRAKMKEQK